MIAAVLSLTAALAGWSIAAAATGTRPWIVAVASGLMAYETAVVRPRLDEGADIRAAQAWRRVELVSLVVGVKLLQVLGGTSTLLDFELGFAVTVTTMMWGLANATISDLDGVERAIELTDGSTPLQRIRRRFVGVGLAAVASAAWGAVGLGGLLDLDRPAAVSWSWAPMAYLLVGLLAVGTVSRIGAARRWERDGASVDSSVYLRWRRSVLVTVAVLALVGLTIQAADTGLSAAPAAGFRYTGGFGAWLAERAAALQEAVEGTADREAGDSDPASVSPPAFDTAEPVAPWLGDVALWVFVAMIFAYAIVRGRDHRVRDRRGSVGGPRMMDVLRLVARSMWSLATGLLAAVRRLLGRVAGPSATDRAGPPEDVGGFAPSWNPVDPIRRRIAGAYRRAVQALSTSHGTPHAPDTVREYAGRVADRRFDTVSGVFEEARYSDHVFSDADAVRAEEAAHRLETGEDSTR